MSRLIDADALRQAIYHEAFETDSDMQRWDSGCWIRYKMFERAIEAAPTIEAEPVVRCKDCAHCEIWKHPITNNVMYFCTPTKPHITDPDGYCEKGEKRNAETD